MSSNFNWEIRELWSLETTKSADIQKSNLYYLKYKKLCKKLIHLINPQKFIALFVHCEVTTTATPNIYIYVSKVMHNKVYTAELHVPIVRA